MRSRRRLPGRALAGAPPLMPAGQLIAAPLYQEGIRPQDRTPGIGPVNGKQTQ